MAGRIRGGRPSPVCGRGWSGAFRTLAGRGVKKLTQVLPLSLFFYTFTCFFYDKVKFARAFPPPCRGRKGVRSGERSVEVTLVATGSEVALAAEARKQLLAMNIQTRLVSMPSTTVFDRQDKEYRDFVLGEGRPVVAIEAGRTDGWWKYIRGAGTVIGLDRFGESAPASELFKLFGFTVDNVVETVQHVLSQGK